MFNIADDLSKGVEETKVYVDDGVKIEDITDFVYIRKNIPGPGTKSNDFTDEFQGCECKEETCSESTCKCIKVFGPSYDNSGVLVSVNPYQRSMKPVLECNKNCACSKSCINRVVQCGVKCKLQVFDTNTKGIGVKTLEQIKKDSFVCEYAGEILIDKVAKRRTELVKAADSNYILVVREYSSTGKLQTTYIDPTYIGNVGRFINHSCEPNLYMVPVRVECNIPKLALFALKDINKGDELCYDYSGEIHLDNPGDVHVPDDIDVITSQRKRCLCSSKFCRGVLPLDSTLYDA